MVLVHFENLFLSIFNNGSLSMYGPYDLLPCDSVGRLAGLLQTGVDVFRPHGILRYSLESYESVDIKLV